MPKWRELFVWVGEIFLISLLIAFANKYIFSSEKYDVASILAELFEGKYTYALLIIVGIVMARKSNCINEWGGYGTVAILFSLLMVLPIT